MNYPFFALLIPCCIYAFVAGGGPERWGAAAYGLACLGSFILLSMAPLTRFQSMELGIFVIDVLVFVAFMVLAMRANRFWPIWVSGLLGLGVLGHLARWAGPEVIPWAYAVILTIWSYPILALITIGTYLHQRRLKRHGSDRSWLPRRKSMPPPAAPTG